MHEITDEQGNSYKHIWYVYTLAYPDGTVFYVGMGHGKRMFQHERVTHNPGVSASICMVKQMGMTVQKRVIATFIVKQHAHMFERMLIETYGIDSLANVKSEIGNDTRKLVKPIELSNIQFDNRRPISSQQIDTIMYEMQTKQPWEDEGALI